MQHTLSAISTEQTKSGSTYQLKATPTKRQAAEASEHNRSTPAGTTAATAVVSESSVEAPSAVPSAPPPAEPSSISPAMSPAKTPAKTPAKSPAKRPVKSTAKAPTKSPAAMTPRKRARTGLSTYFEQDSTSLQLPTAELAHASAAPTELANALGNSVEGLFFMFLPKSMWLSIATESNRDPAMVEATPVIAMAAQAQVSGHVVHEARRVLAVAPVM
ncbi:hypothetical protein PR002_g15619 [Phytophthora rubi]|uniref:Uncharacterized protein n=1 Tax=Phytophthora rubi TaxID=129364 RepID=A0A6A3KPF2_9STRA|nr:hypothetical protein PR002_g15619 [Phytophthora rubi]